MEKDKEKLHILTIRLPHDLWVQLRNLQTVGHIRSIQDAVVRSLRKYLKDQKMTIYQD